jgi:hypothetical protein
VRASFIHIEEQLRRVLDNAVPGDLAELGVWYGTTFLPMAELGRLHGRTVHAVDSFRGMARETERDGGRYTEGSHNVGGSTVFRKLVAPLSNVVVHEGYVPEILAELADVRLAFVHLDIDQYAPTLAALRHLWPRMSAGGVLMVHDYHPDWTILASAAIREFALEIDRAPEGPTFSHHGWFVKPRGLAG